MVTGVPFDRVGASVALAADAGGAGAVVDHPTLVGHGSPLVLHQSPSLPLASWMRWSRGTRIPGAVMPRVCLGSRMSRNATCRPQVGHRIPSGVRLVEAPGWPGGGRERPVAS